MDGKTTIKYLQTYIKEKDYHSELLKDYFLKLSEEVGKLSRAMRKGLKAQNNTEIPGTIDEELWDVIYYALAIANIYDVDIEQVAKVKSERLKSDFCTENKRKRTVTLMCHGPFLCIVIQKYWFVVINQSLFYTHH